MVEEAKEIKKLIYDDKEDGDMLYGDGHEILLVRKSLLIFNGDLQTIGREPISLYYLYSCR